MGDMGDTIRESRTSRDVQKAGAVERHPDAEPEAEKPARSHHPDRAGLIAGVAALTACAGLVLYGVLDSDPSDGTPEHRTPSAAVTYEVTGDGTADISYQARDESGKATVIKGAALPWRTTVDVPLGQDPIVSIVLGEHGGQARCAVAVRGRHVQSATATGVFGRATCSGILPQPEASEG